MSDLIGGSLMNRFERMFGILLHLSGGQAVSAVELGQRFEVSTRTVYRDVEMLSELGVPIYAERGRFGGYRLLDGYYVPPLMFTNKEAISLLLGLTFIQSLTVKPFSDDLNVARAKLLSSIPAHLRTVLARAERVIGFESPPKDAFHPESGQSPPDRSIDKHNQLKADALGTWIQAILEAVAVRLAYRSPYRNKIEKTYVNPLGLFYDRDHWYLIGQNRDQDNRTKFWRLDRLLDIEHLQLPANPNVDFDVRLHLDRRWLQSAMTHWRAQAPVKIRMTAKQADRLSQDWYYAHASYEHIDDQTVMMSYGEDDIAIVMELLRWLGPGAELIEPADWRRTACEELKRMIATYDST
jgi:predicted DNA-binding transcriptional regulator YafY